MAPLILQARVEQAGGIGESAVALAEPINWHVGPVLGDSRYTNSTRRLKRALDIVASLLLLIVLSPVLAAVALTIRLDSPGPALFRQSRVGFREQPFTIWKFRTMANGNDDGEHRAFVTAMLRGELDVDDDAHVDRNGNPVFKLVTDARITRIGAFLRRTSLDELPQLINVLNGTMSLVGPRPSLDYELAEYSKTQRLRATAMPGMTGLWQVEGRNSMAMNEALALDVRYVRTCSLRQDLHILARTAKLLVSGTGH